jgi:hypothetical protein
VIAPASTVNAISTKVSASKGQLYELAKNFLQAVKGMGEA